MRHFLEISYLGTRYSGWQRQPNATSVQGEIEKALSQLLNQETEIVGAGRTDAGVHCLQTFAHFEAPEEMPDKLSYRLNQMLPVDIAIEKAVPIHTDAHARYDAVERSYEYRIHFEKDPFLAGRSHYFPHPQPKLDKLNEAAQALLKFQDFRPLSKDNPDNAHTRCDVYSALWETLPSGNGLVFRISANRFLWNMVRRTVGVLLAIGQGKMSLQEFEEGMGSGEPQWTNLTAPPEGLYLAAVRYPYPIP